MSKSNAFETAFLQLIFNNSDIANIGDATGVRGSTAVGSLYLSLHTADPGEAGTQLSSETTYTSYSRVAVARSAGQFAISGNTLSLASTTSFPAGGAGAAGTLTHFGIGTSASGAGTLLYSGTITPSIAAGPSVTPQLSAGMALAED